MVSDNIKAGIFFGFAGVWIIWGIIDYLFSYALQVFLGLMVMVLMGWIVVVVWNMMHVVVPAGSVRIDYY